MDEPPQTPLLPPGFHLDSSTLFASLLWGSIGAGYMIYGKKQRSAPAFAGGILMIVVSYFSTTVWMSVISVGIMVGVYFWSRYE
ncbi:MAG TPA: amino acid transport protein [Verrucomicrobiae bacterium]|jgi:hypothetical protein|nr:amino acid transport protein [Verrucomicrobiae bacterium]